MPTGSERAIPRNLDVVHKGNPDELAWIDGRFWIWGHQFPLSSPQLDARYANGMTRDRPQGEMRTVSEFALLVANGFSVDDSGRRIEIRRRTDSNGFTRFGIDFRVS